MRSGSIFEELLDHVMSVWRLFLIMLGLWLVRRVLLPPLMLLELQNLVIDLLCVVLLIGLTAFDVERLSYSSKGLRV